MRIAEKSLIFIRRCFCPIEGSAAFPQCLGGWPASCPFTILNTIGGRIKAISSLFKRRGQTIRETIEYSLKIHLKNRYAGGQTMLSVETMNFLKNWLTNHIQVADKRYSAFFTEKGVK